LRNVIDLLIFLLYEVIDDIGKAKGSLGWQRKNAISPCERNDKQVWRAQWVDESQNISL